MHELKQRNTSQGQSQGQKLLEDCLSQWSVLLARSTSLVTFSSDLQTCPNMEEEKLQAIKKNLMGSLEEEFEDNLDDIDENDLDEFLMNTEEETNANKERKNKDQEMASSEEANTTENKENDDPKNKAENLHRKDADQKIVHSETPSWTSKGRSITSPQVWC